ncbi:MAG: PstS family phosphate ABC transporter substrate-binding protein [Rickettsiales bacterium]|nr:PstS family phosphate ABC transporter substrate-binding protein [Rickettsiales bacterium]
MPLRRAALLVAVFALGFAAPAFARDQIRIVGSSTVYPFTTTAAESFGQGGQFKTPIVETTGTGGGFKLFCEGVGIDTPDISNASRPITDAEKELCKKNGVTEIVELAIGYDGIVLAQKKGAPALSLTKKQLFTALAKQLPGKDGTLAANPNKLWSDVDASLPKSPITVYGPPPTSGTRDAFAELVMEKGCEAFPAFAKLYADKKERQKACHAIRDDGAYVDSGEDDNVIIQKLTSNEQALGVFGYSYYDNSRAKIQAVKVDGVLPEMATVESGKYGVSRSLYVYVKKQHLGEVPGIAEFAREMLSEAAIGEDGYNTAKGLLPMGEKDKKKAREQLAKLVK